jgi:hypothetical protein
MEFLSSSCVAPPPMTPTRSILSMKKRAHTPMTVHTPSAASAMSTLSGKKHRFSTSNCDSSGVDRQTPKCARTQGSVVGDSVTVSVSKKATSSPSGATGKCVHTPSSASTARASGVSKVRH